jgi:tRNA(fMet)-specific endonuclease VapC
MAKPLYLLDMPVLTELTRPDGNRRVFTLFQQRQGACALAAPALYAFVRGVESLPEGMRKREFGGFVRELLRSGPSVLPFSGEAALWLARQAARWDIQGRRWNRLDGEQAAIAAVNDLAWVTRTPASVAGADGLRIEDWFRP